MGCRRTIYGVQFTKIGESNGNPDLFVFWRYFRRELGLCERPGSRGRAGEASRWVDGCRDHRLQGRSRRRRARREALRRKLRRMPRRSGEEAVPARPIWFARCWCWTTRKGILIAPVLRDGRPDQGMPKPESHRSRRSPTSSPGCTSRPMRPDHRHHLRVPGRAHRRCEKGRGVFQCHRQVRHCHSATGDLKGIGKKLRAVRLASAMAAAPRWRGGGGRGGRCHAAQRDHGDGDAALRQNGFRARSIASTISTFLCTIPRANIIPLPARAPRPKSKFTIR